ncbi:MAG TPA: DUF952 domain-containing protein [Anaerolineales bacterium]|nr:DUF952 domain-containing protein [Anaerolineales bacterium]HLO32028.1 DUF952 domain-containing protein [Anaerolineales bacterium]
MIYHIATRRAWREALQRGEYRAESLKTEGFIHCSTNAQVVPVAERYYKGERGLFLLMIDPSLLSSETKWEPPSGGTPTGVPETALFPHIYGPINLDAIVKIFDLISNPDGKYNLPVLD